ncbi:MAG: hypothetical protein QG601_2287 [Pseudomonadota bacterium]|nr:hypothetical protein [Pseudomonadota bacterium]
MTDLKGPAVDPEAFRVEGHCCGIRLPVLQELTAEGIRFELPAEVKAEPAALSGSLSEACFVPLLARIDDADDQQHDRHLDQHPDDGGERSA